MGEDTANKSATRSLYAAICQPHAGITSAARRRHIDCMPATGWQYAGHPLACHSLSSSLSMMSFNLEKTLRDSSATIDDSWEMSGAAPSVSGPREPLVARFGLPCFGAALL